MSLWVNCLRGAEVVSSDMYVSHDEVQDALEQALDRHFQEGRRVRNILRNGEPAWEVLEEGGALHYTYWVARGGLNRSMQSEVRVT